MKTKLIGLLLGLLIGGGAAMMIIQIAHAGCAKDCWTRTCAKSYGYTAVNEPYRVTHEEWVDDDIKTSSAEGVDCSGLVNKTWALVNASGSSGFYRWNTNEPLSDGGYSAGGFYYECNYHTNVCYQICTGGSCSYSTTNEMDAFATLNGAGDTDNHIGLIYTESSNGYDYILEAIDRAGTDQDVSINYRNWRNSSSYRGLKRTNWTPAGNCSSCSCP